MRRLALAVATAAVVFLSLGGVHAAEARPFASLDRVFADRPDELLGPQVHLVYGVPSGSQDGALDTDGHVGDIAADLMYAFAFPGTRQLNPGHDDYYGPPGDDHLPASCPSTANVANSLFLTSHPFVWLSVAI